MHFSSERQAAILARLDRDGRIVSATLADELRVSPDSIRRDLQELEVAGALRRVHGGAVRLPVGSPEFLERLEEDDPVKDVLARRTADLLGDDQLIAIGGCTTAVTLARALRRDLRATVLTSSLDVALGLLLEEFPDGIDSAGYWIAFNNFYVLTRYNRSRLYAAAVHELAKAIKAAREATR